MNNMVNHPNHYQTKSGIETIDVMKAFTEELKGAEAVDTSQVLKYICRWKQKNGLEDLKKAKWYLDDLIEEVSKQDNQEQETESNVKESIEESFARWVDCEMRAHNLDADHFGAILWEVMFNEKSRMTPVFRISDNIIFDNIIFDTRYDAEQLIVHMLKTCERYGVVTIMDMYDLSYLIPPYKSELYGWTSLEGTEIARSRYGYFIKFPNPIKINKEESK